MTDTAGAALSKPAHTEAKVALAIYTSASEIRRYFPTLQHQLEYHRRVSALVAYTKTNRYRIADLEAQAAMATTVDEMRERGEIPVQSDGRGGAGKSNSLLDIIGPEGPMAVSRWSHVASVPEGKRQEYYAEEDTPNRAGLLAWWRQKNATHVSHNSGNNEWYTPAEYIEAARDVMGGIDLDPASTAAANEIVKAKRFYSIADDGLKKKWKGRVWLNPPYAMPLVFDFCVKFATHVEDEDVPEGIVLVNNATETRWFAQLADVASAVAFPTGRVKFWSQTRTTATPLQGQAILYAGKNRTRFIDEFGQFGWVAKRLFPIEGACCRHRNNKP